MKKLVLFFILICCGILSYFMAFNSFQKHERETLKINNEYTYYLNKEIFGTELATIINKVVNYNNMYDIPKDDNDNYIMDDINSLTMEIYIIDSETVYSAERIYALGTERFVTNFDTAKFKCTKIEYHEKNNKVKYLYFEQISN